MYGLKGHGYRSGGLFEHSSVIKCQCQMRAPTQDAAMWSHYGPDVVCDRYRSCLSTQLQLQQYQVKLYSCRNESGVSIDRRLPM